jgi:NADPH-dependent F420 reductase
VTKTVGIIGGTGPEGKGLAARFARAGLDVFIGSRSAEKGEEAAAACAELSGGKVSGGTNAGAANAGETVIVTLPYEGLAETLKPLAPAIGAKIVVSTVAPLRFGGGWVDMLPTERGSAAEDIQLLLPDARVVAAFQNLAARKLANLSHALEGDVIVCSDHAEALQEVIALAEAIGTRGVNAGALANSRYVEGITALLVSVNRNYKQETAVRVVGI